MGKYDITSEVIINANPDVVYNAIADGRITEWLPISAKRLSGASYDEVGALTDITFHDRPIKYTEETVEAKKNEMIRVKYVKGAVRGEGLWKLEGINGKTKLSFRWRARHSEVFLRIIAPFVSVAKKHSDFMKVAFDGLKKHLEHKSES